MKNKLIGIYEIRNLENEKVYVGSSIDIKKRWREHKNQLNKGKHHSIYLQKSWDKYGSKKFTFSIIELIEKSEKLIEREQYWIDYYKSYDKTHGFNMSKFAISPNKGEGERQQGSKNHQSKLSEDDVITIFSMVEIGVKQSDISKRYNISPSVITNIKRKQRWTHVLSDKEDIPEKDPLLSEFQIKEIKVMLMNNHRQSCIADRFNVSRTTIKSIKNGVIHNGILPSEEMLNDDKYKSKNTNRLDESMVIEIKKMLLEGILQKDIANKFNVSIYTISDIKRNKNWKHVTI